MSNKERSFNLKPSSAGWPVFAALALLLPANSSQCAVTAEEPAPSARNVLILHSYHSGFPWTDDLTRGFESVLATEGHEYFYHVEYMDAARHSDPGYRREFAHMLKTKYSGWHFDLLAVFDDAALQLLLDDPKLFPGAPAVFGGINEQDLASRVDRRRFAGVVEVLGTGDMLDLALKLHKDVRQVLVITGGSSTSDTIRHEFELLAPKHPYLNFRFLDGRIMTMDQILEALRDSGRDSIGIVGGVTRDATGRYFPGATSLKLMGAASNVPLYSPANSDLGQGVLAGSENGGLRHGRMVGALGLKVFSGIAPETLPIEYDAENYFLFDNPQMKRWGIAEVELAASLRNREPPAFLLPR